MISRTPSKVSFRVHILIFQEDCLASDNGGVLGCEVNLPLRSENYLANQDYEECTQKFVDVYAS